jgi:hypothetical protein
MNKPPKLIVDFKRFMKKKKKKKNQKLSPMKREQRTEVEKAAPPRAEGYWSRDNEILREETAARE